MIQVKTVNKVLLGREYNVKQVKVDSKFLANFELMAELFYSEIGSDKDMLIEPTE